MKDAVTTESGTRHRPINAVEALLLTSSYDEVSVRSLCTHAGANLAAVHYHFGTKDELVVALLQDRLEPLWNKHLQALAASEATHVVTYLDAIVGPLRDLAGDPGGQVRLHLLTRMLVSTAPHQWTGEWFQTDRWVSLLCAAKPGLSPEEAARRWIFAFRLTLLEFGKPDVAPKSAFGSGRGPDGEFRWRRTDG